MRDLMNMLRGSRLRLSSYISFALIVTFAIPVHADDTHYQDFLVGGRALGLGGAYVSLADDPSGVYLIRRDWQMYANRVFKSRQVSMDLSEAKSIPIHFLLLFQVLLI